MKCRIGFAMLLCRHDHQVLCPLLHSDVQHAASVCVAAGSLHSAGCQHCCLAWPGSQQEVSRDNCAYRKRETNYPYRKVRCQAARHALIMCVAGSETLRPCTYHACCWIRDFEACASPCLNSGHVSMYASGLSAMPVQHELAREASLTANSVRG